MTCKRSGVRIHIAPLQVRDIIRNPEPQDSGAWYSSKVPQRQRREVPYSHSDKAPSPVRAAGMALPRPGAETAWILLSGQNAHSSLHVTLVPLSVCGLAGSPAARVLRVTLAACADGQPGGRAVRCDDLLWLRGKRCRAPEERRDLAAGCRTAWWRPCAQRGWDEGAGTARDRAALGTSSAGSAP